MKEHGHRSSEKRRMLPGDEQGNPSASHVSDDDENDAGEEEETDDRKPPAREVVVRRSTPERPLPPSDESTTSSLMTPFASTPAERMQLIPSSFPAGVSTHKVASYEPIQPRNLHQNYTTNNNDTITIPNLSHDEFEQEQRAIQTRIYFLAGTIAVSISAFLYIVLPFYALMALLVMAASSGLISREIFQYALMEYGDRMQHRGFGELFPDWLYRMLTEQTLHELLMTIYDPTDPGFINPNRHLILYLLPGLTIEQRNAFIQRLPARHRQMLERPGLGQLLGPEFMRFLLGQGGQEDRERTEQARRGTQRQQRRLGSSPSSTLGGEERRALEHAVPAAGLRNEDDSASSHSDMGLNISGSDLTGGMSDDQARRMARTLRLRDGSGITNETVVTIPEEEVFEEDNESVDDDSNQEQDEDDMRIIVEAAMTTVWSHIEDITSPITSYFAGWASHASRQAAASVASSGGRLALVTGGIGLLGYLTLGGGVQRAREGEGSQMMLAGALLRGLITPLWQGGSRGGGGGRQRDVWSMMVLGGGGAATVLYTTGWMLHPDKPGGKESPQKK